MGIKQPHHFTVFVEAPVLVGLSPRRECTTAQEKQQTSKSKQLRHRREHLKLAAQFGTLWGGLFPFQKLLESLSIGLLSF